MLCAPQALIEGRPEPALLAEASTAEPMRPYAIRYCNLAMQRVLGVESVHPTFGQLEESEVFRDIELSIREAVELGLSCTLSPALGGLGVPWEFEVLALEGGGCLVQGRDFGPLEVMERQLERQASEIGWLRRELDRRATDAARAVYTDLGTGLQNRKAFQEHLRRALNRAAHEAHLGAVALLDINDFTVLNESIGPAAADEVLKVVAERFAGALRDVDTVARYGGDVFVLLIDGITRAEDALATIYRVIQSLSSPIWVRAQEVYVSVAVGVSVYPSDGQELDLLMQNAETALARAKEAGANSIQMYSAQLSRRTEEQLSLTAALRRAVEGMDFEVHLQPQLDTDGAVVVGAEALLRWSEKDRHQLSPAVFVPILEDSSLIDRVGTWVLEESCRMAQSWSKPISVSVNVSAKQFHSGDLVTAVRNAIDQSGFEATRLELELTEGVLISDIARSARTLRELKLMGVSIAIDDFGTGYSSLSYLKRFPVDTLKIDRSFVRDVEQDADGQVICRAIIKLAHELGLKVVAEGVETEQQRRILSGYGCHFFQGYLFAKPMHSDYFKHWLDEA